MHLICAISLVDNKKICEAELYLTDSKQLMLKTFDDKKNHWPALDIFEAMGFDVLQQTENQGGICFVHKTLNLDIYVLFSDSIMYTLKAGKYMHICHIILNKNSVDIYGLEAKQYAKKPNLERICHFEPSRSLFRNIKLKLLKLRMRARLAPTVN